MLVTGVACRPGSRSAKSKARTPTTAAAGARPVLRIAQWRHGVPTYDAWFDDEFTKRWGEEHAVEVIVDHLDIA